MITLLIIAGLLGIFLPHLGFLTLLVGGIFLASTPAGLLSLALVVLLIIGIMKLR